MAGDRGLAFVVIGLIGISAFWVSNQHRIEPRPAHTHAAQIDSTTSAYPVSLQLQSASPVLGDGDVDQTWYVFGRRNRDHGGVTMLGYPELSGPTADAFSPFGKHPGSVMETQIAPPMD